MLDISVPRAIPLIWLKHDPDAFLAVFFVFIFIFITAFLYFPFPTCLFNPWPYLLNVLLLWMRWNILQHWALYTPRAFDETRREDEWSYLSVLYKAWDWTRTISQLIPPGDDPVSTLYPRVLFSRRTSDITSSSLRAVCFPVHILSSER